MHRLIQAQHQPVIPLHRTVPRTGQNTWPARASQTTGQATASNSPAHRSEHLAGSRQSDHRAGQCIDQSCTPVRTHGWLVPVRPLGRPMHRPVLRTGQNTWPARASQTTGQATASNSHAHRSEHLAGSRQSDHRAGQCIVQPYPGAGKTVL